MIGRPYVHHEPSNPACPCSSCEARRELIAERAWVSSSTRRVAGTVTAWTDDGITLRLPSGRSVTIPDSEVDL